MRRLVVAGLFVILCGASWAQSLAQSLDPLPQFEVSDVHASGHLSNRNMATGLRDGRFAIRDATMSDLIRFAYSVDPDQVIGGPRWLEWDRFEILAKYPASNPSEQARLMLRSLLADRFKLAVHTDSKPLPTYVLSLGSGKPKLKEADGSGKGCTRQQQPPQPGSIASIAFSCRSATMQQLVNVIRTQGGDYLRESINDPTGRVADQTDLKGSWDFDLKWTNQPQLKAAGADGISLFDALDRQLGLSLHRSETPTPVVVVDRVNETPSPNPPGTETALKLQTEFDVASIKPSMPGAQKRLRIQVDRIDLQSYTIKDLIAYAWNLNVAVVDQVLVGVPKFGESSAFDVLAKAKAPVLDAEELREMLRALLIDRFKLKVHSEDRPIEAYTLTAAKPKLKPTQDPSARTKCIPRPFQAEFEMTCQNITISEFAQRLINAPGMQFPVLDATGIEGRWDLTLNWIVLNQSGGANTPGQTVPEASLPSGGLLLPDAINKQLGLKMELRKRPLPVLVVDHVDENPSEN
jgi:uncharacterized protein (TIGR03435 family)